MLFNKHVVTLKLLNKDLKFETETYTRYIPVSRTKMEEAQEISTWMSKMPSQGIDFTYEVQEGV